MIEKIDEKISVISFYDAKKGSSLPYKIFWQGREYKILKIGYHHKVREGRGLFHIFSVSTVNMAFRLKYDTETLHWILEEVSDGNPT